MSAGKKFSLLLLFVISTVAIAYFYPAFTPAPIIVAAVIAALISLRARKANTAQVKDVVMPAIAAKFGRRVEVSADDDYTVGFARDGTVFVGKIEWLAGIERFAREAEFMVRFSQPDMQEKFFLQHQSVFSKHSPDCQPVSLPALPEGFILHSLNAEFSASLFADGKILAEIRKYPASWTDRFRIAFENGRFELTWRVAGMSEESDTSIMKEKLQQVCQTAVVFHEQFPRFAVKNR